MKNTEILYQDWQRNHPESTSLMPSLEEILSRLIDGWSIDRYGDTLILYKITGALGQGIEFHCYNGASGEELATNVLAFMESARQGGYEWCSTPYTSPRVKQLFEANIDATNLITYEADGQYITTVTL